MSTDLKVHSVHAGMATMPSRVRTARFAIRSLLHQVDRLHLYLDGFDEVPHFAVHPKISVIRSQDQPGLHANGKLIALATLPKEAFFMTVDDDHRYPRNFVRRLRNALLENPNFAVVGMHGSNLKQPFRSYTLDREVFTSWKPLRRIQEVDVIATCGTMHHVSRLQFDVQTWQVTNQVDLHFARELRAAAGRAAVVRKPWFWALPLGVNQSDSIFRKLKGNDASQTELAQRLFGHSSFTS